MDKKKLISLGIVIVLAVAGAFLKMDLKAAVCGDAAALEVVK